jgi:hypothetical protein
MRELLGWQAEGATHAGTMEEMPLGSGTVVSYEVARH